MKTIFQLFSKNEQELIADDKQHVNQGSSHKRWEGILRINLQFFRFSENMLYVQIKM